MKSRIERGEWWWLTAVCAIALILRLLNLNAPLWYDEILTLVRFVRLPVARLLTDYSSLNNHVFFSLQAHAVIAVLGEHPWTLRLPAALFGVGGVAATWWLARLVVGRWEALLTAAMLAVSYHHIWFSQNARGYTGLLFWILIATVMFLEGARTSSWKYWALYALSVGAAGFIHLSAAFFFATQALIYAAIVIRRFGQGARWSADDKYAVLAGPMPLVAMTAGVLLTILLYAGLIPQIVETMSAVSGAAPEITKSPDAGGTPAKWSNPLWMILEVARSFSSLGPLLVAALPIALVLMIVGARSLAQRNAVLVATYVLYVPLTLALLVAAGFRLWPRYFLVEISFGFIALCRGIIVVSEALEERTPICNWLRISRGRLGMLAGGAALLASMVLLPKNYLHPKQDFAGAMELIEREKGPRDAVATLGLAAAPYREYYRPSWQVIKTTKDLADLRKRHAATWIVNSFSAHTRGHYPEIMDTLETEFELVREFPGTLGDGDVFVWRARP